MIDKLSIIPHSQMDISQRTIGSLVAEDFRRASVFKRHGIDFCCAGGRTLETACKKRGVSVNDVLVEFELAEKGRKGEAIRADKLDVGVLADYIVNHHHNYVRESVPGLREMTEKVARVHGAGLNLSPVQRNCTRVGAAHGERGGNTVSVCERIGKT